MKILVLNSGSSCHKACIYEFGDSLPPRPEACLWEAKIEWSSGTAATVVKNSHGAIERNQVRFTSRLEVLNDVSSSSWRGPAAVLAHASEIDAVGHRIVHGGPDFEDPVTITPEVYAAIEKVSPFAPLHIPSELEGIRAIENLLGAVPQVAVFDTGFHRRMPLAASVYPGPYEWFERGIKRYGFHGINHQYCAGRSTQMVGASRPLKLITCHLGSGCSVAAIDGERSVDTSMGFTPLDGLMMGTRSGSVDPGILTFLIREQKLTGAELDNLLNQRSGLLGISGLSGDMRDILAAIRAGHDRARLAFEIYIHRLRSAIGAMTAVLGGVDALIFTGGIGENSPEVRQAACEGLEFLGLRLDPARNAVPTLDEDISAGNSRARILVIRAGENWAIASATWTLAR